MQKRLLSLARAFWPDLASRSENEQAAGVLDVVSFLYSLPMALAGLVWLILVTDLDLLRREWPVLLLLLVLAALARRLPFFLIVKLGPNVYGDFSGALDEIFTWSAALLFGPTALWIEVALVGISLFRRWLPSSLTAERWNIARNASFQLANTVLAGLVALALYRLLGGTFPLAGLNWESMRPALYATLALALLGRIIPLPMIAYASLTSGLTTSRAARLGMVRILAFFLAQGIVLLPFAILSAGLYAELGLGTFIFFAMALLLAALLAHQLGQAAERARQRSQELEQLERLSRAIIEAPPDASTLPEILRQHIPEMFPLVQGEIRIFPDRVLLHYPEGQAVVAAGPAWEWLRTATEARCFLPKAALPWGGQQAKRSVLLTAPILDADQARPSGGIYLCPEILPGQDPRAMANRLPAIQTLASQISSALNRAAAYERTLAHQKMEQELALAWEIQASFLPTELPRAPGWQFTAMLQPAQQTSGDFYDFIPLPDGQWGIVIADVAGKGMSAALYMALSRTLLRTHAMQPRLRPAQVLSATNARLLADSQADIFVTVFFGLLDPARGTLTYGNAGHNPPYLLRAGGEPRMLLATGAPLGYLDDVTWAEAVVQLEPGDLLVSYTDGITEAEDGRGGFFGQARLLELLQAQRSATTGELAAAILAAVHDFRGDYPQTDDLTLMVIKWGE